MIDNNAFDSIKIGLASPEQIRAWSYGEVKKPETINYRTLKPERDGLFCERIFGPTKDWECHCGKYKRIRFKGKICDRCGVEVTRAKVRRERMGHIELAAPVSHIWYFKGIPSRISLMLDISPRTLENVLYFSRYIVTDPGNCRDLEKNQCLSEKEYAEMREKYDNDFEAGMGAESIQKLLKEIDLEQLSAQLKEELETASGQKRVRILKRLDVVESFRLSGNRPEWMIMDVIPVIPPDIRPMVQLDGGRFATSDLNDLYRRVINRNNRLKKLLELNAPEIIIRNEKRMLQESVDALIDNGRRGRPVTGPNNRPLKSLSDMLKGKQGRFRQNLLGKRVDYSGRSVIVVGPELKMYQCGLPKEMAIELFKPFVMKRLVETKAVINIKAARKAVERAKDEVWDALEVVIKGHPVLLNRAPTLHRLGIQAFEPVLVEGRALKLHPLACTAYNADFDGDQMAVHVPLSEEAQAEARLLMLGSNNILHPKSGDPIVTPSQDMVLGNYYITMEKAGEDGEGRVFKDCNEALMAYERREITLHTRIAIPVDSFKYKIFTESQKGKYLVTTTGKIKFNEILPDSFPYINEPTDENIQNITPNKYFLPQGANIKEEISKMDLVKPFAKGTLEKIIAQVFKRYKTTETSAMLDKMKDLGFYYSTIAGITVSMADIATSRHKQDFVNEGQAMVDKINKQYSRGLITEEERHEKVIETWYGVKDKVQAELEDISKEQIDNPIFMMMHSKARGNISNFTQVAGMRGLMQKPNGDPIEIPVLSNFKEGLSVSEFFLSTHSARKGDADTALKTADSGYLTRRLVDVSQDMIVREEDCGTEQGVIAHAFINEKTGSVIESLKDRIVGRYASKKVINPNTKEVIIDRNEFITEALADKVVAAGIETVEIRTILTCNTEKGVCQKCYGRNLATGNLVEIGEAIGVMAAQSIGEPGTQLTMRTFHTGGVAGGEDITQGLPRVQELFEARNPKGKATIAEIDGKVSKITEDHGKFKISITNKLETKEHVSNYGAKLAIEKGQEVHCGDKLTEGAISPKELLAVTDPITTQEYILKEVQNTYRSQGVDISDKHIEVIARRMISKIRIVDSGDTTFLPGSLVNFREFTEGNKEIIIKGKKPATGRPILLGITKASLETDSFLSAASFQETTRILTDASIRGKVDKLEGLKENVLLGKLIPAGTGLKHYRDVSYNLESELLDDEPLDKLEDEIME